MSLSRATPDDSRDEHRILASLRAGDKIRFLPLLRQHEINDIITSIRIDNDGELVIFTYGRETVYNVFAMAGSKWYHRIDSPLTIAAAELGALPMEIKTRSHDGKSSMRILMFHHSSWVVFMDTRLGRMCCLWLWKNQGEGLTKRNEKKRSRKRLRPRRQTRHCSLKIKNLSGILNSLACFLMPTAETNSNSVQRFDFRAVRLSIETPFLFIDHNMFIQMLRMSRLLQRLKRARSRNRCSPWRIRRWHRSTLLM